MAAFATETGLTVDLVIVIPGTASRAQSIGTIGAIGMIAWEESQGAITTIIKNAEKQ
ncbi:MAG: hypothetical protein NT143_01255 [Actinobacteria bacterium]|nr:hypothetical protein [Actinomycetota bacterium]